MKKILLVEDNELNRDMLGRRLKRRGYELVTAVDGQEGVSKAQSENPDLILMDMSLPVMDGWTATGKLKANQNTASIPIIALTAHAMVGDRDKALSAGCDDYDTKPVDIKRLLEKMECLLSSTLAPSNSESPQNRPPSVSTSEKSSTPVSQVTSQSIASSQLANITPPSKKATGKILIVDDIEENRDMLSRRLLRKSYETVLADSGEAALKVLDTTEISLVLLDVMMPGIGGIETLRQIRQRYSRLELPVIMVTAKDQGDDIVQAFNLGANDYVTKPLDLSVLIVRIQAQLKTINLSNTNNIVDAPSATEVVSEPKESETTERYRKIKVLSSTPISQIFTAQDLENSDEPLRIVQKIQLQIHDPAILSTARNIFSDEVKKLETIKNNDGILLPVDAFEKDGSFYLISEYVEGCLFSADTAKALPQDMRKVVRITEEILRIIEPLHYRDIAHYQLNHSCFIIPKHGDGRLILINTGIHNRLLLKLTEIYPTETFLPSNDEGCQFFSSIDREAGYQADISAIGMIALQILSGKSEAYALESLKFNESKWSIFDSVNNADLINFFKNMLCQDRDDAYTSIPDASRDILKLWFNLNYKDKVSETSEI